MKGHAVTLLLAALLLAAAVTGGAPLLLDRPTFGSFLLCHVTHLSSRHLFFSGLTTVVMAAALEHRLGSGRLLALLGATAVAVSGAVLVFEQGRLADYCGASGVGYALAGALAVGLHPRCSIPILGLLAVKVGFEFLTGRCLGDVSLGAAGAVPVPVAHAVGLAIGSILGSRLEPQMTAGGRSPAAIASA